MDKREFETIYNKTMRALYYKSRNCKDYIKILNKFCSKLKDDIDKVGFLVC